MSVMDAMELCGGENKTGVAPGLPLGGPGTGGRETLFVLPNGSVSACETPAFKHASWTTPAHILVNYHWCLPYHLVQRIALLHKMQSVLFCTVHQGRSCVSPVPEVKNLLNGMVKGRRFATVSVISISVPSFWIAHSSFRLIICNVGE